MCSQPSSNHFCRPASTAFPRRCTTACGVPRGSSYCLQRKENQLPKVVAGQCRFQHRTSPQEQTRLSCVLLQPQNGVLQPAARGQPRRTHQAGSEICFPRKSASVRRDDLLRRSVRTFRTSCASATASRHRCPRSGQRRRSNSSGPGRSKYAGLDLLQTEIAPHLRHRCGLRQHSIGQRLRFDHLAWPQDHGPLHGVAQLAARCRARHNSLAPSRPQAKVEASVDQPCVQKMPKTVRPVPAGPRAGRGVAARPLRRRSADTADPREIAPRAHRHPDSDWWPRPRAGPTVACRVSPIRSNLRSWRNRSSLACRLGEISPTSSNSSVPPSADSTRPGWSRTAPVNAPMA